MSCSCCGSWVLVFELGGAAGPVVVCARCDGLWMPGRSRYLDPDGYSVYLDELAEWMVETQHRREQGPAL